jgi:hypothetical protein
MKSKEPGYLFFKFLILASRNFCGSALFWARLKIFLNKI